MNYYWQEYAGQLPIEHKALAMRMQNIRLTLLNDDITFEVVVDNEIVAKDFTSMIPNVQNYLRSRLKNRKVKMTGPCQCTCRERTCLQQGREIPDDGKEK